MRLFIAITLDQAEKEQLQKGIDLLRAEAESGSYSREENLHLTVVFLGETPSWRIADIRAAMRSVQRAPFRITAGGSGSFPRRDGDVCWIGIRHQQELEALRRELCAALLAAGFAISEKEFCPHLTLGRRVRMKSRETIERLGQAVEPFSIAVDGITLMESKQSAGRLVYEPVYQMRFEADLRRQRQ